MDAMVDLEVVARNRIPVIQLVVNHYTDLTSLASKRRMLPNISKIMKEYLAKYI